MKVANAGSFISEKKHYGKKYLNTDCNSREFLNAISYTVSLNELLQLKRSLSYQEKAPYSPMIFEIQVQRLRDYYRGNFLLQLWSLDGKKFYEKVLKFDIVSWNIQRDYLIFKPDPREEGQQYIYIVCFKNEFKEIKVKNFVTDPSYQYLGVSQELLHVGNSSTIKIVDIQRDFGAEKEIKIEPKSDQIVTFEIKGSCKLHGFFENNFSVDDTYIMCLIETLDNQIDFARLYNWERANMTNPILEFYQYREVVKRDLRGDPIQKIVQVIMKNDFQFGMALRSSGKIDIYWNFTLTQTPDEYYMDIACNYNTLYAKQNKQDGMKIIGLDIKWDSRIGMDVAIESTYTDKLWHKISEQQIKQYLKLYSSFTLINTTFLVAYNNIVSTFDVIKKMWLDHYIQDENIVELLRNQRDASSDDYIVGVLLQSGKIVPLESTNVDGINIWKQSDQGILNVGHGIKKIVSDWRDIASHYIQTENDNRIKVMGYQNCTIRELTGDIKVIEGDYMVRFISQDFTEDIAMVNVNEGKIRIFKNETHHTAECSVKLSREVKFQDGWKITKRIHTAVENKSSDYLFFFDEENVYIINQKDGTMTKVSDMNITSLQLIDGDFIYSMTNDCPSKNLSCGFYFYDLNQLIEKAEESFNFKLKGALVGHNNLIDYYRQDERIAYMTDYEEIKIVPVLHRNTINLFVMQKRKNYVGYHRIKDKLIALDKNNVLTTWNITTGKVVGQTKLKTEIVTKEYKTYRMNPQDVTYESGWYSPYVLLYNPIEEVQNVDEKQFYGDRLHTSLPNNQSYTLIENKKFRTFKVIQIINESEVVEKLTFVHPHLDFNTYQKIYFSDDLEYMLERLVNQRVLLFKQSPSSTPGQVNWTLVRRIKQFPMDLSECTYANYLFSPDLQYYLDFDKSENVFLIRRSIDQTTKCQIPKGIMNPSTEDPGMIGKRFRWVNSNVIKVINSEGIEKIIDVQNGFKDINQDTIPMIDLSDFKIDQYHYYFSPKNLQISDTEARLVRKFQSYNSAVYLDQVQDKDQLYETIFELDFSADDYKEKVIVNTSFTFIHWKLAELLSNPQLKIKLRRFSMKDIKQTCLNIFPKGNTVLHYSYKQLNNIRKLYDIVNTYNDTLDESGVKVEIPFVQNFKGVSPLHLCIEDNNYKSAEIFLQKLSNTPLDSHSRAIVDILHKFVENGIPSFGSYLDNRMMQTQQLIVRGNKRGAIQCKDDLSYAVASCELWPDIDNVDRLLFSQDPRESEVKLEFLDMPKLHSYNEQSGDDFFKALADSNDIELFQYRSIQACIDYKWPLAREYTIKILFIPFIIFHLAFLIYSNAFTGQYEFEADTKLGSWWIGHNILCAVLYLFSIYFLSNEVRQFWVTGIDYLSSVWNYSDLIPPILIIIVVSLKLNTYYNNDFQPDNIIYTIHSLATLLMWMKLLYFLRIFRSTGYLVRTLTDVIYDMKVFLLILFIVYFGFGEAFLRLSEKSDPEMQFIMNYAYCWVYAFRLSVGDNATDTFNDTVQPVTLWILWVIAGILTNIVMLNLLISIISESFAKINEKSKEANYQERARIISENSYLIPRYVKNSQDDFDKYIIVANEVIDTQDEEQNALKNQVKALDDKINEFKNQMTKQQETLENKLNSLLE